MADKKSAHSKSERASEEGENLAERLYEELTERLLKYKGVTLPIGKKGFGSSALWFNGRIFAFLSSKDKLVVKLPSNRVDELLEQKEGERFDPGHGRPMKQWLSIDEKSEDLWLTFAKEALEHAKSG